MSGRLHRSQAGYYIGGLLLWLPKHIPNHNQVNRRTLCCAKYVDKNLSRF